MITRGLPRRHLAYVYRILGALCALAALWAGVLLLTGGLVVEFGGLRISSRQPRNAVLISLLCAVSVWLLSFLPDGRTTLRGEWARWQHWYASTHVWRDRAWQVIYVVASPLTIAVAAIAIDISQWGAGLPMWLDEEMIALNVRDRSMAGLAGLLWLEQSAPFGWLVLERLAMAIFGTGELAMRAVPLLFGIATVGVAAWIGRRWMGRIAGAVLVVLCWLSPHWRTIVSRSSTTRPMPSSDCCSRPSLPGRSRQTAQPTARAEYGCGGLQRPSVIGSRTERFSLLRPARSFSVSSSGDTADVLRYGSQRVDCSGSSRLAFTI